MPLRWGILATAWIADLVAPCFEMAGGAELRAVASRDHARARDFAERHGLSAAYGSYEDLLADDAVDAVYIAVPNSLHSQWIERAVAAKKHVLCEKPLTLTVDDAERAFMRAEAAGVVLMEGFMYRHHPQIQQLEAIIDNGALGEIVAIHSTFFTQAGDETNIRFDPALGGGALWDVGSYCVSLSTLLGGGEPDAVAGVAVIGATGVDVGFSGLLRLPNGSTATFACGLEADLRTEATIIGTERTATLANPWLPDIPADIWHGPMPASEVLLHRGTSVDRQSVPGRNPYSLEIENLARAARGDSAALVAPEETIRNLRAVIKLRQSAGLDQA